MENDQSKVPSALSNHSEQTSKQQAVVDIPPQKLLKWVAPRVLSPPVMVIGKKRVAAAISDSNLLGNTGRQK